MSFTKVLEEHSSEFNLNDLDIIQVSLKYNMRNIGELNEELFCFLKKGRPFFTCNSTQNNIRFISYDQFEEYAKSENTYDEKTFIEVFGADSSVMNIVSVSDVVFLKGLNFIGLVKNRWDKNPIEMNILKK